MFVITVRAEFNAAHMLRGYCGKCESLHGHNWSVELSAGKKTLDKIGMVLDFGELKKELNNLLENLDHKFLNELDYFRKINPTSENIAKFIYDGMSLFCRKQKIKLLSVTVWETPTSAATYEASK
jgi:6-pyruvoyltetrahydropterin/6-carboxytetrahydropterin synthase